MKKIIIITIVFIFGLTWVFAFSPSKELQEKMDKVVHNLEDIIKKDWENIRDRIIISLKNYKNKYKENQEVLYILDYIITKIDNKSDENLVSFGDSFFEEYSIDDWNYWTQTYVTLSWNQRKISTNALPNHKTWNFPNSWNPNIISSQKISYSVPYSGEYVWNKTSAKIPGIAVNGVKFEPETAEVVRCISGEEYRIEAIQEMVNLGLDHQHAHVQPTGEYHYHGISESLVEFAYNWEDLVHIGFAKDGFPMYYSKKGAYKPSYKLSDKLRNGTGCKYRNKKINLDDTRPDGTYVSDWEYIEGFGDLDACNGIEINWDYIYLVTDEYPATNFLINLEMGPFKGCMNYKYRNKINKFRWYKNGPDGTYVSDWI